MSISKEKIKNWTCQIGVDKNVCMHMQLMWFGKTWIYTFVCTCTWMENSSITYLIYAQFILFYFFFSQSKVKYFRDFIKDILSRSMSVLFLQRKIQTIVISRNNFFFLCISFYFTDWISCLSLPQKKNKTKIYFNCCCFFLWFDNECFFVFFLANGTWTKIVNVSIENNGSNEPWFYCDGNTMDYSGSRCCLHRK